MKRTALLLSLCLLLTGCAHESTPTEPTSGQQALWATQAGETWQELTLPDRFTAHWTDTLRADARVTASQGTKMPLAFIQRHRLTQEDLDRLLAAFAKGNPCRGNTVETKQYAQLQIDALHQAYDGKEWPEDAKARLKKLERSLKSLPDEADLPPVTSLWYDQGFDCPVFYGEATVDGTDWEFQIIDNGTTMTQALCYEKTYGPYGASRIQLEDGQDFSYVQPPQQITPEKAKALGDQLMEALGQTNMVCDDIRQGLNGAQLLCYVPTVQGIRLSAIVQQHRNTQGEISPYVTYQAPRDMDGGFSWENARILLEVGTQGILAFRWTMPFEVTELVTDQAKLLDFDTIAQIARDILPQVVTLPPDTKTATVDQVDLTLMQVHDKGSDTATILPVWDFWATVTQEYNEDTPIRQVLLTLNAIDGSVIRRENGY